MRRLVWIFALLAVLWYGWWMLASSMLERSVAGWLTDRRAEGWQADVAAVTMAGFPGRLDMTLESVALADPATGVALDAGELRLSALAYWPGDVTVTLPNTPIRLTTPDISLSVTAQAAQADLRLHPRTSLQLERLSATSGPWTLDAPEGPLLWADDFSAEVIQGQEAETYRFALNATQLTPGGRIRKTLKLADDWPLAFETFIADVTVTFDAPLDRFTLENRRPQPREIHADRIEAHWGGLRLVAQGMLSVDAEGIPDGQLDLLFENWREALDLAGKNGAVPAGMLPQAELMLSALAYMSDNPDTLDLSIAFRGGAAYLGPISLGPAPRLILR